MEKLVFEMEQLQSILPAAQELSDSQMEEFVGGGCGCGLICTFTAECRCASGLTVCYGGWLCKS